MRNSTCKLCNRKFNYKYTLFGRGCLNSAYNILEIQMPEKVEDKELYLCNQVARKLHKVGLSKRKKFDKKIIESKRLIDKVNFEQLTEDLILNGMQFAFNLLKKKNPIMYKVYYYMQYEFWNDIMLGGLLVNFKLSSKLMEHSLGDIDYKPDDVVVSEPEFINKIKRNQSFKNKIKSLINKYGRNRSVLEVNEKTVNKDEYKDIIVEFSDNYDLYLSLHRATLNIIGAKNGNGKWELTVTITDTYDFTDLKNLKEIYDSGNSPLKVIGLILNNYGVASMKYGVLKEYNVTINLEINEDELE